MKIFNNLQELWDYFLLCPVCSASDRVVGISVGPDKYLSDATFTKTDNKLTINAKFKPRPEQLAIDIQYDIDCLEGSFKVTCPLVLVGEDSNLAKVSGSNFYFYLNCDCNNCHFSYGNSSDIHLVPSIFFSEKTDFSVERESFYLMKTEDKYHITIFHHENKMLVSKCLITNDQFIETSHVFECSPIKIDFSNYDRIINKIKTLILFS